ncbi:ubiquitin hydrolase [Leptolyngbya sp. PCC 7375]|nr:ubiquitin hydrolase [Leptolyngbya sp. PCC 7375]
MTYTKDNQLESKKSDQSEPKKGDNLKRSDKERNRKYSNTNINNSHRELDKKVDLIIQFQKINKDDSFQGASVTLAPTSYQGSSLKGIANKDDVVSFSKIRIGDYNVSTDQDRYLPIQIRVSVGKKKTVKLQPAVILMYLDANRTGSIDVGRDKAQDAGKWNRQRGAIILFNNISDNSSESGDTKQETKKGKTKRTISQATNIASIAPLVFCCPNPKISLKDYKAELSLAPEQKNFIRIFNDRNPGAAQILGEGIDSFKYKLTSSEIKTLQSGKTLEFGMEATRYSGPNFNGLINLTFTTTKGLFFKNKTIQKSKVRIAPWMMLHHLYPVKRVFMVKMPANLSHLYKAFREQFKKIDLSINELENPNPWYPMTFCQDWMEIGFSCLPNCVIHTIIPSPYLEKEKTIKDRIGLLSKQEQIRSYSESFGTQNNQSDFGPDGLGNLEVTPPISKKYPFGRIYHGPNLSPGLVNFLKAQRVQPPFVIDASWMYTGHVDEVVTFVPAPKLGHNQAYCALVPSPKLALDLLRQATTDKGFIMLNDKEIDANESGPKTIITSSMPKTIENFNRHLNSLFYKDRLGQQLYHGPSGEPSDFNLQEYNSRIEDTIQEKVVKVLKEEIGLQAEQLIYVPVLFIEHKKKTIALTANMVNLLVVNESLCIFPKPYGPEVTIKIEGTKSHSVDKEESSTHKKESEFTIPKKDVEKGESRDLFEEYLQQALWKIGVQGIAIDTWQGYHMNHGEVHCATNVIRHVKPIKWWTFGSRKGGVWSSPNRLPSVRLPQGSISEGLANLGNTCYLNSVFKLLAIMPEFNTLLKHKLTQDKDIKARQDFQENLLALFNFLEPSTSKSIASSSNKKLYQYLSNLFSDADCTQGLLWNSGWHNSKYIQCDAHAFLAYLLEALESDLLPLKICQKIAPLENEPGQVSLKNTPDIFLIAPALQDNHKTIQDTINAYFAEEEVDDYKFENINYPQDKQTSRVKKQYFLMGPPKFFIYRSMREVQVGGSIQKANRAIQIKLKITLAYYTENKGNFTKAGEADLIPWGIIRHIGSTLTRGHYTMLQRTAAPPNKANWVEHNDTSVKLISDSKIQDDISEDQKKDPETNYLILYKLSEDRPEKSKGN